MKSANLLQKQGIDDSQMHTTVGRFLPKWKILQVVYHNFQVFEKQDELSPYTLLILSSTARNQLDIVRPKAIQIRFSDIKLVIV